MKINRTFQSNVTLKDKAPLHLKVTKKPLKSGFFNLTTSIVSILLQYTAAPPPPPFFLHLSSLERLLCLQRPPLQNKNGINELFSRLTCFQEKHNSKNTFLILCFSSSFSIAIGDDPESLISGNDGTDFESFIPIELRI